jgi:hypothetical protein
MQDPIFLPDKDTNSVSHPCTPDMTACTSWSVVEPLRGLPLIARIFIYAPFVWLILILVGRLGLVLVSLKLQAVMQPGWFPGPAIYAVTPGNSGAGHPAS